MHCKLYPNHTPTESTYNQSELDNFSFAVNSRDTAAQNGEYLTEDAFKLHDDFLVKGTVSHTFDSDSGIDFEVVHIPSKTNIVVQSKGVEENTENPNGTGNNEILKSLALTKNWCDATICISFSEFSKEAKSVGRTDPDIFLWNTSNFFQFIKTLDTESRNKLYSKHFDDYQATEPIKNVLVDDQSSNAFSRDPPKLRMLDEFDEPAAQKYQELAETLAEYVKQADGDFPSTKDFSTSDTLHKPSFETHFGKITHAAEQIGVPRHGQRTHVTRNEQCVHHICKLSSFKPMTNDLVSLVEDYSTYSIDRFHNEIGDDDAINAVGYIGEITGDGEKHETSTNRHDILCEYLLLDWALDDTPTANQLIAYTGLSSHSPLRTQFASFNQLQALADEIPDETKTPEKIKELHMLLDQLSSITPSDLATNTLPNKKFSINNIRSATAIDIQKYQRLCGSWITTLLCADKPVTPGQLKHSSYDKNGILSELITIAQ